MRTLSTSVFSRNSAKAWADSIPMVFPPRWISSTILGSAFDNIGSISARVLSFKPSPCKEKILGSETILAIVGDVVVHRTSYADSKCVFVFNRNNVLAPEIVI